MTDGLSLSLQREQQTEAPIDLSTFASWIELQPVSTLAGMLDLIANDLYRRHMYAYGNEIKHVVSELRA